MKIIRSCQEATCSAPLQRKYQPLPRQITRTSPAGKRLSASPLPDPHSQGPLVCHIYKLGILNLTLEQGTVSQVKVNMGAPCLKTSEIPVIADAQQAVNVPLEAGGKIYHMTDVFRQGAPIFTFTWDTVPCSRVKLRYLIPASVSTLICV